MEGFGRLSVGLLQVADWRTEVGRKRGDWRQTHAAQSFQKPLIKE